MTMQQQRQQHSRLFHFNNDAYFGPRRAMFRSAHNLITFSNGTDKRKDIERGMKAMDLARGEGQRGGIAGSWMRHGQLKEHSVDNWELG